ncbi:includes 2-hydroxyacyl-coa dehydratase [Holotrichia oblita]|nr:includes 2-hydroxyacyl-coa dehydratase [Holotrichia oblita]
MKKAYLGIDIGSISTKGVVIDKDNNILADSYLWTAGNPIQAVKEVLKVLSQKLDSGYAVVNAGTTGSARKLIGAALSARVVKNEITAHAVGTISIVPDVKTILEIGGQDSKIILLNNGIVSDYAMNTLCAAGTGAFLSSQARRLDLALEDFAPLALTSKNPAKIAARCTVFAESDLVHKAQIGYSKADIVAGLCRAIVLNYLNNVGKGKQIKQPVVFQGGVSKNAAVVKEFERELGMPVYVDSRGHLMGALGVAVLCKSEVEESVFDFNITETNFETKGVECQNCPNNCEIICVYKNRALLDAWGNKCEREAQDLRTLILKENVACEIYEYDVSDYIESKKMIDAVLGDFLNIDILVNNAGIARDMPIIRMSEQDFDDVIKINLKGAFNMIKHLYSQFMNNRKGTIINMASICGLRGWAWQANYAASKGGLISLTKSVAKELASRGVTCNAIAPGFIETKMTEKLANEAKDKFIKDIPLHRAGQPEDVAKLAAFLAGDGASYITGEVIKVDGGLCI